VSSGPTTKGRLCLVAAALVWSVGGVVIKSIDAHPFAIAFYRNLFAAVGLSLFLKKTSWQFSVKLPFCMLSYAFCIATYLWAMKVTTAANAIFLQYTWPIFVFVISVAVLRKRVDRRNLMALILGMAGVFIVFMGRGGADDALGIVLGVASGLGFALTAVFLSLLSRFDSVYLTFMCNIGGAVLMLPFAWEHLHVSVPTLAATLFLGWFQLALGYFLFAVGVRTVSPQEAGIITLLEPVFNPVWVAIFVHELPNTWTVVGGGLIAAALVVRYALMGARASRADAEPDGTGLERERTCEQDH